MDIIDKLLDGLLVTSQWRAARRVVGQILDNGLRPQKYVLGKILNKYYDDLDIQSIFDLIKQLENSGMQRSHLIYQDGLRLLRRLLLNERSDYHENPLQRNSELIKLIEPQSIKELVKSIWDCPNGFYVGHMCATFFEMWSVDAGCSPILQQELCTYLTRTPEFQVEIFADFISVLDKSRKNSSAVREACADLLNGLLLEALALDDKDLAVRIIFPSMESHFIQIHDKCLSSLIELLWNAGTSSRGTARRLFGLRCHNGFLGKHKVGPYEVLIQATSTEAEIFFTVENLLFSHQRLYNPKISFYNVRIIIQHGPRRKGFSTSLAHDCIDKVEDVLANTFQPPLKIIRFYPSTDSTPQDVVIVSYPSIISWLQFNGHLSGSSRIYSNRQN